MKQLTIGLFLLLPRSFKSLAELFLLYIVALGVAWLDVSERR